jgi:uncharacterized membrane protein
LNPAVPGSTNRRAVRWLRNQLPELVSSGVISSENARAIEHHYESTESRSSFGFVLLASIGSALIGAGVILLIAHNWDDLSRGTRTAIAFLPLVIAQALALFVLFQRNESQAWRESVAIFDVAAVATAISLISQTYQIQGTLADFMLVWLLLSIPIVYLFRTTLGAVAYLIGTLVWLFARESWFTQRPSPNLFWLFLLLVLPYYLVLLRRDRTSRALTVLSIFLVVAATFGLGFTAEFTGANIGALAFAGLFAAAYLCGMKFFPAVENQRLHSLALIGGLGVGITAIVLSFQGTWHMTSNSNSITASARAIGIGIELFFPVAAILLLAAEYLRRRRIIFSVAAATVPLVAALAWVIANLASATNRTQDTPYSLGAAAVFDIYSLVLGIELIARGVRANSLTRANFGLLLIAALAIARFFDTDLGFVTRGLGFIVVGAGFLVANIIFFRKRVTT